MASKSKSIPMCRDEHHSVSVRRIDNGFIVSKTVSGPKGYKSSEEFHAKKPNLELPKAATGKTAPRK